MEDSTPPAADPTRVAISFDLPVQLHDHVVRICGLRGVTLDQAIADLLARFFPIHNPDDRDARP